MSLKWTNVQVDRYYVITYTYLYLYIYVLNLHTMVRYMVALDHISRRFIKTTGCFYHEVCYSPWVHPGKQHPDPDIISEICDFTRGILANLLKIVRHYLVQKSSKIWTSLSGKIYAPYREYLVQFGIPAGLSPLSHYAERHPPLELPGAITPGAPLR